MSKIKRNREFFIEKSKEIFGDKYDLSKVEFTDFKHDKVTIICPIHVEFTMLPVNFLKSKGCPQCYKESKYNTDYFIEKSRLIHGDKYDYSKSNYINSLAKTTIICPIHGEFQQMPIEHMRGQGCPKCKFDSQRNLHGFDDIKTYFLTKAKEVHGDKYDYSKVELEYISKKVCIICPVHGEFWQKANDHLKGRGCSKCRRKKCNTEKFIQKSKEIYGEKYNYSKVNYVNKSTKVCIIDKDNGEFWQTPETHFKKGKKHHFYNTEKFIEKAKEIHGDKYDYSKTEYVDMHTKVCIICPIHGEFWQKS